MVSRNRSSGNRAEELKRKGQQMRQENNAVPTGFELAKTIEQRMEQLKSIFGISTKEWKDWKWQLNNRINSVSRLGEIIDLTVDEREDINRVGKLFRWSISPYFASLIDPDDSRCPIRMQSVPTNKELIDTGAELDPMNEEGTSPVSAVTRRYPDRIIMNVTNQCPMFCRHCQRRRRIGQRDLHTSDARIQEAIDYIKENSEIRDILVTGGDALTMSDDRLDWILGQLHDIPTVEIIRLGSRVPSTLPYRVTPDLCNMLSKYRPLFLNTQFNHPREITEDAAKACDSLSRAGVSLGNQSVLLAGVNNDIVRQRVLYQTLLRIGVRPYYLFHCKDVRGISHFRTSIDLGVEILENLRGFTSGMAIPQFIVNTPRGLGKVSLIPNYIHSVGKDHVMLRTWEKKKVKYPNPSDEVLHRRRCLDANSEIR